jgi:hypothetical protein
MCNAEEIVTGTEATLIVWLAEFDCNPFIYLSYGADPVVGINAFRSSPTEFDVTAVYTERERPRITSSKAPAQSSNNLYADNNHTAGARALHTYLADAHHERAHTARPSQPPSLQTLKPPAPPPSASEDG